MEISVIVCLLVILLAIWIVSVRKKLAIMDENINHSMNQIGVQLSSRFDALLSLLDFTKKYAGYEAQTLTDEVNEKRCIIGNFHTGGGFAPGRCDKRGAFPDTDGFRRISGFD